MSKENEIKERSELTGSWTLWFEPEENSLSHGFELLEQLLDPVMDVESDFYMPLEVDYQLSEYEENESISDVMKRRPDWNDRQRSSYRNQSGIQYEKLQKLLSAESNYTYIHTLSFVAADVEIDTGDGCEIINRNSEQYIHENGDRSDPVLPRSDLLEIKFRWGDFDDPHLLVDITTYADIWFEKSERGENNRDRLREFLDKISSAGNIVDTEFESYYYSDPLE